MKIVEGQKVDLINPFPLSEVGRVYSWLHCYKSIIESDLSPKDEDEYKEHFIEAVPNTISYGVIDKNGAIDPNHEAPLIGIVAFEKQTSWNYYIHIASRRKCWARGFMDEAIRLAITDLFNNNPQVLRISALILKNNSPVKGMASRLGFKFEGLLEDFVTQNGEPKSVLHLGYTRKNWFTPPLPDEEIKEE